MHEKNSSSMCITLRNWMIMDSQHTYSVQKLVSVAKEIQEEESSVVGQRHCGIDGESTQA